MAHRLTGQALNVVEAPVYAVHRQDGTDAPTYPLIDWGVYLVQPFVNWLPEFSDDEFGYGLAATGAVMIDVDGNLVFRHQRLIDIDLFAQEVMAYAAIDTFVKRSSVKEVRVYVALSVAKRRKYHELAFEGRVDRKL